MIFLRKLSPTLRGPRASSRNLLYLSLLRLCLFWNVLKSSIPLCLFHKHDDCLEIKSIAKFQEKIPKFRWKIVWRCKLFRKQCVSSKNKIILSLCLHLDWNFPCNIITFLSFELHEWFSSLKRSEFNQEFNSELIFLLEPLEAFSYRAVPRYHWNIALEGHKRELKSDLN